MGCARRPPEPAALSPARRRGVLQGIAGASALLACPWPAAAATRAAEPAEVGLLRSGGLVVMLRHALTTPGVGDPEGFQPGVCSTQRNLSEEGREQSRRIGAWFQRHGLVPAAVRSSAWCRCRDTAQLAFGRHTLWPVIDSTFGSGESAARLPAVAQALKQLPRGAFEVWVTHQVNITSATGANLAMGHGVIVRPATGGGALPGDVLGRLDFGA